MVTTPLEWLGETGVGVSSGNNENNSDITQLTNGNYVITWTSNDPSGVGSPPGSDIRAQIFDSQGNEVGGELRLNVQNTSSGEGNPSIAALPGGGFAVTYSTLKVVGAIPPTFESDIYVDVFNANGSHVHGNTIFNGAPTSGVEAINPQIAANDDRAVITWADPSDGDVMMREYNPVGNSLNGALTVADLLTGTGEGVSGPEVAALTNDTFAIVYANLNDPGNDLIEVRIYNSDTNTFGPRQTVDSTLSSNTDPSVAALTNGRFVVTWTTDGTGGTNSGPRARIMNSDGTAFSGVLATATTTGGNQVGTTAAAIDGGGFVVFWFDEDTHDLHGQRYNSNGARVGTEFDVENWTSTDISNIEATRMEDGRVAITWTADFSDQIVYQAIWDPRDEANVTPVYTTNQQVGTPEGNIITVAAGTEEVYGHTGSDVILVNSTDETGLEADGGTGTDTFQMRNPGTYTLTGTAITNFEELKFNNGAGAGLRDATILASQFAQFSTVDFAEGAGFQDILTILMGATSTVDYSGLTIQDFNGIDDKIEIIGDSTAETIIGTSVNDTIAAGGGLDTLDGAGGFDTLDLSNGFYSGNVTVNLTTGIVSSSQGNEDAKNFENVEGSGANETIVGTDAHANEIRGNAGNDTITGGDLADRTFGGAGDDRFRILSPGDINDGTEIIDGGADTDTIEWSSSTLNQTLNLRNESITSIEEIEFGSASNGADRTVQVDAIQFTNGAFASNLLLDGYSVGTYTETFEIFLTASTSFNGSSFTFSGWGTQGEVIRIIGDSTAETITGTTQADTIDGNSGNDTINGFGGDDILEGGAGADSLSGSTGIDTAFYGNAAGVVANLTNSGVNTGEAFGDTYSSIENLVGSNLTDALTGNAGVNRIEGGGGNDFIIGLGGNDVLVGGDGGDRLEGNEGADQLFGGDDFDIAFYRNATTGAVTVDLQAGTGSGGEAQGDTYDSIEQASGSFFSDTLLGDSGINGLSGSGGNDILDGRGGNDSLFGSVGNDTFRFQNGHGQDRVLDFTNGQDVLDYSTHTQVNAIGDLTIFDSGTGNTVIQDGLGGQVVLLGVAAGTIDASDFVF